jgi:hypothetical protein
MAVFVTPIIPWFWALFLVGPKTDTPKIHLDIYETHHFVKYQFKSTKH